MSSSLPSFEPAPFTTRVLAALLDLLIVTAGSYLLMTPIFFLLGIDVALDQPLSFEQGIRLMVVILLCLLLVMVATHTYYIWFEYEKGATLGKKAMGLEVISVDGKRLTKKQAILRELMRWYVDVFLIPAVVSMAVTQRRQRVGDVLAGTVVVSAQKTPA